MRPSILMQYGHDFIEADGVFIRALGRQGIKNVRHRKNSCSQRNLFASQLARITLAIPFFMMSGNNLVSTIQPPDTSNDFLSQKTWVRIICISS